MEVERKPQLNKVQVLAIQMCFLGGVTYGLYGDQFDQKQWLVNVARSIFYLLSIQGSREIIRVLYAIAQGVYPTRLEFNRSLLGVFGGAAAVLVTSEQSLFDESFATLFGASLLLACVMAGQTQIFQPGVTKARTISYGQGMACSYFEGYFKHIMSNDGYMYEGLIEKLGKFEAQQGQVFPLKKLILVVPKTLNCPTDLKYFNKDDAKLAYLEALPSLEDVVKDVAAVKNRVYRNPVYKIYRPRGPGGRPKPLCVAVECPTPLHTLHRVYNNRALYQELSDIDIPATVQDFEDTLMKILESSSDCKGKVIIVHFDDTDPKQNLADVLIDKIRELRPDFEEVINERESR